jgi:hypothetical protein
MLSPSVPPFRILHGAEAVAALAHRPSWAALWLRVSDPEPPPQDIETAPGDLAGLAMSAGGRWAAEQEREAAS